MTPIPYDLVVCKQCNARGSWSSFQPPLSPAPDTCPYCQSGELWKYWKHENLAAHNAAVIHDFFRSLGGTLVPQVTMSPLMQKALLDRVIAQAHDDRMNRIDAPDQDSQEPPFALPLSPNQRAELTTHPDFQVLLEKIAERVRALLMEQDDGIEDDLVDLCVEVFAAEGVDPTETPTEWLSELEDQVWKVLLLRLRPLIIKILVTGDWKEKEED